MITGVTSKDQALSAAEAGADAVGFDLSPASALRAEAVRETIKELPPFVLRAGLFKDTPLYQVQEIITFCALDVVVLFGHEDQRYCRALAARVVKKVLVAGSRGDDTEWAAWRQHVAGFLLDGADEFSLAAARELGRVGIPVFWAPPPGLSRVELTGLLAAVAPYALVLDAGSLPAPTWREWIALAHSHGDGWA